MRDIELMLIAAMLRTILARRMRSEGLRVLFGLTVWLNSVGMTASGYLQSTLEVLLVLGSMC